MLNVEKNTKWILSSVVVVTFLTYIFTSLGRSEWVVWLSAIFGVLLGLFLYSETAVISYVKQKGYRRLDTGDIMVWLGAVFGTAVILNSVFFVTAIRNAVPSGFLSFLTGTSVVSGIVAGILALLLLWLPRPN